MAAPVYYTAEMVRSLPRDGNRYETVHGELLVTPSPRLWHQEIVGRLFVVLSRFLTPYRAGHVLMAPADISWSDDTLVQPDIFVADLAETRSLDWHNVKTLHLVIEVLSPSSARSDRFSKRRLYQEIGIPAYWIVDPDERAVEIWTPSLERPKIERHAVEWRPADCPEPLTIPLDELFKPL